MIFTYFGKYKKVKFFAHNIKFYEISEKEEVILVPVDF